MDAGIYGTLTRCLFAAAATLSLGYAGVGPRTIHRRTALPRQRASSPASRGDDQRLVRSDCDVLRPPAGTRLAAHFHATGVQIYRWSGAAWTFVAPEAVLYADPGGRDKVGTHYAGPTWESVGGSTVAGGAARRCTPDSTAIPWLSLTAVSGDRPGVFRRVTFIQRLHTTGGVAPTAPGSFPGQMARVPYTAEYYFYRPAVATEGSAPPAR
jgi:hypothetical protein